MERVPETCPRGCGAELQPSHGSSSQKTYLCGTVVMEGFVIYDGPKCSATQVKKLVESLQNIAEILGEPSRNTRVRIAEELQKALAPYGELQPIGIEDMVATLVESLEPRDLRALLVLMRTKGKELTNALQEELRALAASSS